MSDYISRGLGWVTENGPTAMSALGDRYVSMIINLLM